MVARMMPSSTAVSMTEPSLFGASCGVYVRIVRLALAEKGVAYRLVERDPPELDGPRPRLGLPNAREIIIQVLGVTD